MPEKGKYSHAISCCEWKKVCWLQLFSRHNDDCIEQIKKNCSHKYNMTLWTNPTGENSNQAKWEIGKSSSRKYDFTFENKSRCENGLQLKSGMGGGHVWSSSWATVTFLELFFCRICILRHGWGQFTITCHRCYAIFLQDQPFFSNFPLFEVLETQLTFKSVGEPD